VKKLRNICKSTKMSTVNSIVALISRLRVTSTSSARSVWQIYLSPIFWSFVSLFKTLQVGISVYSHQMNQVNIRNDFITITSSTLS